MSTVVLITGANAGIGFEVVRALRSLRSVVYNLHGKSIASDGAVSHFSRGESVPTSANTLAPVGMDMETEESNKRAASKLQVHHGKVDVIVNDDGQA